MVIQEASVLKRPLMVSNIGGMKEKVIDRKNGLHIVAGNHTDWKNNFIDLISNPSVWNFIYSNINKPLTYQECSKLHLEAL